MKRFLPLLALILSLLLSAPAAAAAAAAAMPPKASAIMPVKVVIPRIDNHPPSPPTSSLIPEEEVIGVLKLSILTDKKGRVISFLNVTGQKKYLYLVRDEIWRWLFSGAGKITIEVTIRGYPITSEADTKPPCDFFTYPNRLTVYYCYPYSLQYAAPN